MLPNNRLSTVLCLLGALLVSGVHAEESNETLSKIYLQLQLDRGNNTLVSSQSDPNENLDLGDGIAGSIGYDFYNELDWKIRLGIGYKQNSAGGFTFTAFPADLLLIYDQDWIEYGVGITYHLEPTLEQPAGVADIGFDSQAGYVLQLEFDLFEHFSLGARYTGIAYGRNDAAGGTIRNNSTGEVTSTLDADYGSVYVKFAF